MKKDKKIKELEQELKATNKMVDVLLKVIDVDDLGMRYADLLSNALDVNSDLLTEYIRGQLEARDARDKEYERIIENLAKTIFNRHDELNDLLEDLIVFLSENSTYEKNNYDMYDYVTRGFKGKCWHISHFAVDILKYKGFDAKIVKKVIGPHEGDQHVWIKVLHPDTGEWFHHDLTWEVDRIARGEEDERCMYMTRDEVYLSHFDIY